MCKGSVILSCVVLSTVCLWGCSSQRVGFHRPDMMYLIHYQSGVGRDLHEIPFPEIIAEWERLFPAYTDARGKRHGFWVSSYEVIFMRPDGTASWVATSKEIWTNGRGDFPVDGDVDALFAKTTNYLHYLDENWPRGEIQEDGSIRVNFRAELLEDGTLRRLDPPVAHTPESGPQP